MSKEMRSGTPSWSPRAAEATTPAAGTGLDQGSGHAQALVDGEHATTGAHEVEGRVLALFKEAGEGVEVAFEDGGDISADGGGAGALVLAHLRQHLAGKEHPDARETGAEGVADGALVVGVKEGEEEADSHGFHVMGLEEGDEGVDFVEGKGDGHLALGVHALGNFKTQVAGGQNLGGRLEHVIEFGAGLPPYLQDIAESRGW